MLGRVIWYDNGSFCYLPQTLPASRCLMRQDARRGWQAQPWGGGGSSLQDTVTRSIRDFNRHHYCMKPVSPWPCRAVFPCALFVAGVASLLLGKLQYLCCFAKCQTMSRSHPPTPCSFWWYRWCSVVAHLLPWPRQSTGVKVSCAWGGKAHLLNFLIWGFNSRLRKSTNGGQCCLCHVTLVAN